MRNLRRLSPSNIRRLAQSTLKEAFDVTTRFSRSDSRLRQRYLFQRPTIDKKLSKFGSFVENKPVDDLIGVLMAAVG